MQKKENQIYKWLETYGGSPWRFNQVMLSQFNEWNDLDYEELFQLILKSKDCIICHYSLVPFFVKYVGVDIRSVYQEVANKHEWDEAEYAKLMSIFPPQFISIYKDDTLESLGCSHLVVGLSKIRLRLIEAGVSQIDKLLVEGLEVEQGRVVIFEKEDDGADS